MTCGGDGCIHGAREDVFPSVLVTVGSGIGAITIFLGKKYSMRDIIS